MHRVPIYDSQGNEVNSFTINDDIEHHDGRVSKGTNVYYKGVGVPYNSHHVHAPNAEYKWNYTCDVFYIGECVTKKCFEGKTGVFQERFQPHFTDWIGACGEKEIQIVENLWELEFEKSAIDVKEWHPIDEEYGQYYLIVDYPDKRVSYLDNPNPSYLLELIQYLVLNDWNFPWDKTSISDVSCSGKVTDVADIFKSDNLTHKLGTVYSVLYSLGQTDREQYNLLCQSLGLDFSSHMSYVINTLTLLSSCGVDITEIVRDNIQDTYRNAVKNFLVEGKNCGFCGVGSCIARPDANQSWGDYIREQYQQQVASL